VVRQLSPELFGLPVELNIQVTAVRDGGYLVGARGLDLRGRPDRYRHGPVPGCARDANHQRAGPGRSPAAHQRVPHTRFVPFPETASPDVACGARISPKATKGSQVGGLRSGPQIMLRSTKRYADLPGQVERRERRAQSEGNASRAGQLLWSDGEGVSS
jgi:hypothetical protein